MKTKVPTWVSILIVAIVFIIVGVGFWWYTRAENNIGNRPYEPSESSVTGDEESSKKEPPSLGESAGKVKINPIDGAEMVWVPAGEFIMGTTDAQAAGELREFPGTFKIFFDAQKPQRSVYLDGYWIYKHEVTVTQYRKFCNATKREMHKLPFWVKDGDYPMVNVDWQDATDYVKWAGMSLPTEAQWEKSARSTDGRKYPWGDEWDESKCANGLGMVVQRMVKRRNGAEPVGSYPAGASPYGCMDMSGNVAEWCADWYDPDYYKNAPSRNPSGPDRPDSQSDHVVRGASWGNMWECEFQCAYRVGIPPTYRYLDTYGFRCAMKP